MTEVPSQISEGMEIIQRKVQGKLSHYITMIKLILTIQMYSKVSCESKVIKVLEKHIGESFYAVNLRRNFLNKLLKEQIAG